MVENGEGDGGLADSTRANESDWNEVFGEIDYLLDQFVASEEGPWWQWWRFPKYARLKREIVHGQDVQISDLV